MRLYGFLIQRFKAFLRIRDDGNIRFGTGDDARLTADGAGVALTGTLDASGGTITLATGEVESDEIATNVIQVIVVDLSAENIKAMYAAPVELIAGVAGKAIVVDSYDFVLTTTATAFTGGGETILQFKNTVNGAGTKAISTSIDAGLIRMAEGVYYSLVSATGAIAVNASADIIEQGIFLSNKDAAFAAGTGTAVLTLRYHLI